MTYVLESDLEFDRLERQSELPNYDHQRELRDLKLLPGGRLLDAGCGSGAACRHLARLFPTAAITGCDLSRDRIRKARLAGSDFKNLRFDTQDLSGLDYPTGAFDVVVCRYVLQHLPDGVRLRAMRELERVLKPGGQVFVVEADGFFINVFPQSPLVTDSLQKLLGRWPVDFHAGRKVPALLSSVGFSRVDWKVSAVDCRGVTAAAEHALMKERLAAARPSLALALGGDATAARFIEEYLSAMGSQEAVYFYSKFTVTAVKAGGLACVR